jgi:MSHA biogenesis protein MshP
MYLNGKSPKTYSQQRGFLLPLALFIIVVMGVLALTISRTSIQTQTSSIQEFANVQAFYAGESGAQRGMQALFLTNTSRLAADTACEAMAINHDFAGVNGLQLCTVSVTCDCIYQNGGACNTGLAANYLPTAAVGVTKSFYTLTSQGSCGVDEFRAERTIQVGAQFEQESL